MSKPSPEGATGGATPAERRAAFIIGAKDCFGMPALVIGSSMVGFGSLARDSGFSWGLSVMSTIAVWGLPGQVAFAEMFAVGAPMLAIMLASSMANLRFLPMSLSMMPLFRDDRATWRWRYLLVVMMSVNTWALTVRRGPSLPVDQRGPYFIGLSTCCMMVGAAGTALGYHLAGALPFPITVSLIFLNPVYFIFLFAGVRHRKFVLALIIGALLGPLFHWVSPDWGLAFCGVIAGTAAYWLDRRMAGGDD